MAQFSTTHTAWQICDCCGGEGKVDHPAFSNGFTSDEWQGMKDDVDHDGTSAAQRYLDGEYDMQCASCSGTGKVKVPHWHAMPRDERKAYIAHLREAREAAYWNAIHIAEVAAERRLGA